MEDFSAVIATGLFVGGMAALMTSARFVPIAPVDNNHLRGETYTQPIDLGAPGDERNYELNRYASLQEYAEARARSQRDTLEFFHPEHGEYQSADESSRFARNYTSINRDV